MTEQEWLEARARGLELRRRIEEGMTRALVESGIMRDCFVRIQAAEQCVHPTVCQCGDDCIPMLGEDTCVRCDLPLAHSG
jgi:adenine deaminase